MASTESSMQANTFRSSSVLPDSAGRWQPNSMTNSRHIHQTNLFIFYIPLKLSFYGKNKHFTTHPQVFCQKIFQKSTKRVHFSIETHSPVLLFTHISIISCCPISTVIVFILGSLYGTIVIKFTAVAILKSFKGFASGWSH